MEESLPICHLHFTFSLIQIAISCVPVHKHFYFQLSFKMRFLIDFLSTWPGVTLQLFSRLNWFFSRLGNGHDFSMAVWLCWHTFTNIYFLKRVGPLVVPFFAVHSLPNRSLFKIHTLNVVLNASAIFDRILCIIARLFFPFFCHSLSSLIETSTFSFGRKCGLNLFTVTFAALGCTSTPFLIYGLWILNAFGSQFEYCRTLSKLGWWFYFK